MDIVLCIVQPYISSVRKPGNSHKVCKFIWLGIVQHLPRESGSEFRYCVGSMFKFVIRIFDIQSFNSVKDTQYFTVSKVDVQRIRTRHVLQLTDHGRHIVAENIQFQQVRIDFMVIEMGCNNIGGRIVCRMLNRTELINFMIVWANYNASRMLTRGSLYTGAVNSQPLFFVFVGWNIPLFEILGNIAECGFVCNSTYSSCLKYIFIAKDRTYISVGYRLIFSSEVKVDIRLFISFKPKESREWNGITIPLHFRAAVRAVHRRHIYTAVVLFHVSPDELLAVWTQIMGIQRIYLCDSCHRRCKR